MGKIRVESIVAAPPRRVFDIARDVDMLPQFMKSLKRIDVLERAPDDSFLRCRWFAEERLVFARQKMCWVQKDWWDEDALTCRSLVDEKEPGNYKSLCATWSFGPRNGGAVMVIEVDFQMEHPLMTRRAHKLLDALMERNNRELLGNIKRRAERDCGCVRLPADR